MAGNISAQLLGLILAPIVTRIYIPEHFGVMIVIVSIVNVLSVIACLRYETAIVLPKNDDSAYNIIAVCIFFTLIVSLIILPFIPIYGDLVESWSHVEGIKIYLYVVSLGILAHGVEQAFRLWYTRKKNFSLIAKTRFFIPLISNSIIIIAGILAGSSVLGLIFGHISGLLIVAAIFLTVFFQHETLDIRVCILILDILTSKNPNFRMMLLQ